MKFQHEPVALVGILRALLLVLVLFGVPLTHEQEAAILLLAGLVLDYLLRRRVTAVDKDGNVLP